MNAPALNLYRPVEDLVFARATAELAVLHQRRRRLCRDHITDPQWAILLQLFVATKSGQQVPTNALRDAAGTSKATLLRLLTGLAMRGLIERRPSSSDKRVTSIHLTSAARELVVRVLRIEA